MKKSTKRLGSIKRKIRRGKPSVKTSLTKQITPLQKARAAKKAIKAKLTLLKAEFKQKLQQAAATAYEKAMHDFQRNHLKTLAAKQKFIAAAEAKFEKKMAKKTNKKTKSSGRRKNTAIHSVAKQSIANKRSRKRGRPRKAA